MIPPSKASAREPRAPGVVRRLLPYWWAFAIPLLVLVSALFARDPLQDAATLGAVPEASLRRSMGYVLLAPFMELLDTLTLLSLRQHIAFVLTMMVAYALWRWIGRHRAVAPATAARRVVRQVVKVALALFALVSLYVVGALLPRPMAAIEVGNDILVVDFHAHTRYSHDGRWNWTPEDVRRWHASGGFGVAFVTDHRTFEGARDGWANNPPIAGQGTNLLPGIEVVWNGEHVNVLDADRVYRGILTSTLRDIDEDALRLSSLIPDKEPLLIETLPGNLSRMVAATGPGTPGVRAVEVSDGAPKGLGQTRRERARIVRLADSLGIALVSGSNHHGWGHTAAAWTLMYVPQWRTVTPDVVSAAISTILRRGGFKGTRVVERYVADTESGVKLPFTVPLVAWGMLRTLSTDERVAFIVWTLFFVALVRLRVLLRAGRAATR